MAKLKTALHWPRRALIAYIHLYQRTISPDHSKLGKIMFPYGYCRFHPTCSDYGCQAIEKYGVLRGGAKALWRIVRCNPLNKGGEDPLK